MTTIVAVERNDRVIFGSDTQATSGSTKKAMKGGKILESGPYVFGLAGLADMIHELHFTDLPPLETDDVARHMHDVFAPYVSEVQNNLFEKLGIPAQYQRDYGSHLLVAVNGSVFDLRIGGKPYQHEDGKYAIGSGSVFALGALAPVKNPGPRDVARALAAAAHNDIYTSGPFKIKTVK